MSLSIAEACKRALEEVVEMVCKVPYMYIIFGVAKAEAVPESREGIPRPPRTYQHNQAATRLSSNHPLQLLQLLLLHIFFLTPHVLRASNLIRQFYHNTIGSILPFASYPTYSALPPIICPLFSLHCFVLLGPPNIFALSFTQHSA